MGDPPLVEDHFVAVGEHAIGHPPKSPFKEGGLQPPFSKETFEIFSVGVGFCFQSTFWARGSVEAIVFGLTCRDLQACLACF
jgi:hypothetical protein